MIWKFLCIFLMVVLVSAIDYNLEFIENGEKYSEKIEINKQASIVKHDVPRHANVQHAEYLTDYKALLTIMKLEKEKTCYAIPITGDEPTPNEIEVGIKQFHGKFPDQRFLAKYIDILAVGVIDAKFLSQPIKDFCGDYPVLKVVRANNVTELEHIALNVLKAHHAGRSKRDIPLPGGFKVCNEFKGKITEEFDKCKKKYGKVIINDHMDMHCWFKPTVTCVHDFACSYQSDINNYMCHGIHSWHTNHCCKYFCK